MQALSLMLLTVSFMLSLATINGFFCPFGCGIVNCANSNSGLTPFCHDVGFQACECTAIQRRLEAASVAYGRT